MKEYTYKGLTHRMLLETFWYDYVNGGLIWRERKGLKGKAKTFNTRFANTKAGNKLHTGYVAINHHGVDFLEHQLVFFYFYGYVPEIIDHVDTKRDNNRIENLREATVSQNMWNTPGNKHKKSGLPKGVFHHGNNGRFKAQIMANRKLYTKGGFVTVEDAVAWLNKMREVLHGGFGREE